MAFLDREEKHAPFLMEVQDAFAVKDGGVILSGKVKSGTIAIGDQVEIIGFSPTIKRALVAAKDIVFQGTIQLQGVSSADIFRGQVVATPGTMKPSTAFWAQVIFSAT